MIVGQTDPQVGARATEMQRGKASFVEELGARGSASLCVRQAATGSGGSAREAAKIASHNLSTATSRLRSGTPLGPGRGGVGHERPVDVEVENGCSTGR